jgi:hypothetical protein
MQTMVKTIAHWVNTEPTAFPAGLASNLMWPAVTQ